MESNVTPHITRSGDSFSTVPKIVNGGDWGCIVRDLDNYHSLGLTSIEFHPPKVIPLTNPAKVTDQDSANATLTPGDGTTAIKVESSA